MSYQLSVTYSLTDKQKYKASIWIYLPVEPSYPFHLLNDYIDSSVRLQNFCLSGDWGRHDADDEFRHNPYPEELIADTVEEIEAAVAKRLFEFREIIHKVYVGRIDRLQALPKDQVFTINPAILHDDRVYEPVPPVENPAIVEINRWRENIAPGDTIKIRVELRDDETGTVFHQGKVTLIDRGEAGSAEWGVELWGQYSYAETWIVKPTDLFPVFLPDAAINTIDAFTA